MSNPPLDFQQNPVEFVMRAARPLALLLFWWILLITPNIRVTGKHFATRAECDQHRLTYYGPSFGCYTEDGKTNAACAKAYIDFLKEPPDSVCISNARTKRMQEPKWPR